MSAQPSSPPPARGVRIHWPDLPLAVRLDFESWAGCRVVSAETQAGGFSPGVAARVRLADDRRVFVKAVSTAQNEKSPDMHRREGIIMQSLPLSTPAPRLLWFYDQGGWVMLVIDEVPGFMPEQPWQPAELARVVGAMDILVDALTPSPLPPSITKTASQHVQDSINGWGVLRSGPPENLAGLDDWALHHLDDLADLEALAPAAAAGSTLLHFDIRADNILLTPEQVWFVDWPHACVGAAWVDLAAFAPSAALNGAPSPEHILQSSRHGRTADPTAVTAFLAALGGFFTQRGTLPPPPGLPTLRAFQTAQGVATQAWLKQRLGA